MNFHKLFFPKCEEEKNFLKNHNALLQESANVLSVENDSLKKSLAELGDKFAECDKVLRLNKCPVALDQVGNTAKSQRKIVEQFFGKFELLDDSYVNVSLNVLKEFLEWWSGVKKYELQENDCDDGARLLWGALKSWSPLCAFGFCTLTMREFRYACVFGIVCDGGELVPVFIEPSDKRVMLKKYNGAVSYDLLVM